MMFRVDQFLKLSFTLLLLVSCANLKREVSIDDLKQIKKIAVVSSMGDEFTMTFIGSNIFANKTESVKVQDWKIDEHAQNDLIKMLSESKKYEKVAPLAGKFDRLELQSKEKRIPLLVRAKDQGFDAIIILMPTSYDNAKMVRPGYGMQRHHAQESPAEFTYMLASLNVIKVETGEQIAWQWTFNPWDQKPGIYDSTKVPWKDQFKNFTKSEKALIQKSLKNRIDEGLKYAITALRLI
jgi:hypothetical protein